MVLIVLDMMEGSFLHLILDLLRRVILLAFVFQIVRPVYMQILLIFCVFVLTLVVILLFLKDIVVNPLVIEVNYLLQVFLDERDMKLSSLVEVVDHSLRDRSSGFLVILPQPYHPAATELSIKHISSMHSSQ